MSDTPRPTFPKRPFAASSPALFLRGSPCPTSRRVSTSGLQPVGLVQGFCVMRWGWYGAGSGYMRGMNPYSGGGQSDGAYVGDLPVPARLRVERAPHVGPERGADLGRRGMVAGVRIRLQPHARRGHGLRRPRRYRRRRPRDQPGRHGDDRIPFPRYRRQRWRTVLLRPAECPGPPTWRASA